MARSTEEISDRMRLYAVSPMLRALLAVKESPSWKGYREFGNAFTSALYRLQQDPTKIRKEIWPVILGMRQKGLLLKCEGAQDTLVGAYVYILAKEIGSKEEIVAIDREVQDGIAKLFPTVLPQEKVNTPEF